MVNKKLMCIFVLIISFFCMQYTTASWAATWEDARDGVIREAEDDDIGMRKIAAIREAKFTDVRPSEWFFQYIEELADKGLARGNPDGTYSPDAPLLVDEFLAFTLRTLGSELPNADGYWAFNYVKHALALGLIDADAYDNYSVPITREQIADIVVRASGESFLNYESYRGIFKDIGTASKPESVLKAIELGVLAGYDDKTFRPKNTATRAEASVIVLRMLDPTYRLELYEDIFYNSKTDLDDNGNMKKDKAKDFMMKGIETLHIGISDSGNAVLTGVIPMLPEGQNFYYEVSIFDEKGTYLSYHTTAARFEEQYIPPRGRHNIETKAAVEDIGHITITMCIAEGELPSNLQEPPSQIVIYKYYHDPGHAKEGFIMRVDDESLITRFDFGMIEGMWGW